MAAIEQGERKMTTGEVATRLRCSESNVYRLTQQGYLVPTRARPRGKLLFKESDVERLLAGGGQPSAVEAPR